MFGHKPMHSSPIMRRIFPTIIVAASLLYLGACQQTEKTEGIPAQIEAAQIEGRNVARSMLHKEWADTVERDRDITAIDSIRRAYPDTAVGSAFYRTFRSTLRTVRPDLYRKLK